MDLPGYAVVGASAADLLTTELALAPGYVEANPLMRDRAARVAIKTLATVAVIKGTDELRRRGHKRWATGLRWVVAGAWGGLAVWNMRQARGH